MIRSRLFAGIAVLAASGGLFVSAAPASHPSRRAAAPAGAIPSALPPIRMADGSRLSVPALRGKIVLVNFWASWCGPCRMELPALDRLAAARPDLVIVAATVDADPNDGARAFAGRYPHLRLAFSDLRAVSRFGALGMPYSVVLNPKGREAARVPRALAWDGPEGAAVLHRAR